MSEPVTAEIEIAAEPERVFDHFTDPELMVRWMGDFARLSPVPGGAFEVDIGGTPVRGRYLEVDRPRRLVITWGHAGSDVLPPGSSTLEVHFTPVADGTRVAVVHRDLPEPHATRHGRGWRHFLGRLAGVAPPPSR